MTVRPTSRRGLFVLLAALAVLASACGSGSDDAGSQTAAGSQATADASTDSASATEGSGIDWTTDGDRDETVEPVTDAVLRVRFYDEPSGFDPASVFRIESENIAFNVFSGLVSYDGVTGEIVPDIATEWATEDNTTWTFQLRDDVSFHKGYGDVTAADVIYSYERIMDPATGSPYASEFASIESMEAPDDYSLIITLSEPDGNFLHKVANYHQGQIVSQAAVEEFGEDFQFNPIGTGPFMFEDYRPGSSFRLVRFDDYFDGPAPLSEIQYSIIKDDETAAIALQNDEVDVVMRQRGDERIQELADLGYRMYMREGYGIAVKMFNPEVEPLSDPRVRQAWAHAVDWQTINDTVSPLSTSTVGNILPAWMDVYTDDVPTYDYDPERAEELLADAGYPDGFSVTALGRTSDGIREQDQLEQSYLAAVGIDLEFELVDTPVNNERRNAGDFEVAGRLLPAINPDMILFGYLAPENIAPAGLNGSRYDNPELYETLLAARAEPDPETRLELYAKVQRIAMTDLPYLPYSQSNQIWPASEDVRGIAINPLAQVDLHDVYLVAG